MLKSSNELKIVTWNCNSIDLKLKEFKNFLYSNAYDIAGICETKTDVKYKLKIPGYKVYLRSRNRHGGGVAIAVKSNIEHSFFKADVIGSTEFIGIKIRSKFSNLVIGQVYKPPDKALSMDDLKNLFSERNMILMGDMNCKRKEWKCVNDNKNGNILLEYCLDHNISIAAPASATNFPTNGNSSVLDLFLLKSGSDYSVPVSKACLSSDHNPVEIKIDFSYSTAKPLLNYDYAKANWANFRNDLNKSLNLVFFIRTKDDVELQTCSLSEDIVQAMKKNIPTKKVKPFASNLPFYIRSLIAFKNKIRRLSQRRNYPWIKELYSKLVKIVRKQLSSFDSRNFENLIKNLNFKDGSIWKFTRKYSKKSELPQTLYDNNGQELKTDTERVNGFAEFYASLSNGFDNLGSKCFTKKVNDTVRQFRKKTVNIEEIQFVTFKEISSIIKELKPNKATGHDIISSRVLKNLPRKAVVFIVKLINGMYCTAHFPANWKTAKVIPVHKKNKDPSRIRNHRPVSLLPHLSKIAETSIKRRLLSFMMAKKFLVDVQFGFRGKHSTTDQLARLVNEITKNFNSKLHTGALILDIEAAFPSVWHTGLIYKLIMADFPAYLILLICSYLEDRNMFVMLNNVISKLFRLLAGVPQGSVLGPLLFLIFINDAPKVSKVDESIFADDKLFFASSFRISAIAKRLQQAWAVNKRYFHKWKIKINDSKTEAILFTKRRPLISDYVYCGDLKIEWLDKVKYLGVVLDHGLTFGDHVNYITQKAVANLIKFYPFFKNRHFDYKCKVTLYQSLVRSAMLYACPVWSMTCKSNIDKIQRIQNKFLRIIGSFRQYTLISLMHDKLNVEYISKCIHNYAAKYFARINAHPNLLVRNISYDKNIKFKHKRIMHIV